MNERASEWTNQQIKAEDLFKHTDEPLTPACFRTIHMSAKPSYANYQTLSSPAASDLALLDVGYERKT